MTWRVVPGPVAGGLDQWRTLRDGTPEQAVAEARDAIAQTGGRGLVAQAEAEIVELESRPP